MYLLQRHQFHLLRELVGSSTPLLQRHQFHLLSLLLIKVARVPQDALNLTSKLRCPRRRTVPPQHTVPLHIFALVLIARSKKP